MDVLGSVLNPVLRSVFRDSDAVPAAPVYDADAQAYFDRMTVQPDSTRKALLNDLFVSLKVSGVYAKRDVYWLPAAHDAQAGRLNLKSASFTLTPAGSPTFVVDKGYQGDGTSACLVTNYSPLAHGVTLTGTSASIMAWLNGCASDVPNGMASIGRSISTTTFLRPSALPSGTLYGRVNGNSQKDYGTVASRLGHRLISRNGPTSSYGYVDGQPSGTDDSQASVALVNETMLLLRLQSTYSSDRICVAAMGAGLSAAEVLAEYNAFNTYLTAIGAN
ncbi:hypothetical protein [Rhizobium leguminosarum]|uniref:hypothetical protein n=1 Tax=Rhizobium leguminosarum TaxID=384 RepID=UPI001C94DD3D|nr:hypothetical protein [Rhizobium leguminosarum]MBY5581853.1 hypothetical protein [Rhizobium leguminosarum]